MSPDQGRADLLEFLGWETSEDGRFAEAVRIILVSSDFSKEVTTAVLWLNEQGLDIRCIRLRPYRVSDGRVLLDVEQILPLPEASDYQTQVKMKAREQSTKADASQARFDFRARFWASLLALSREKSPIQGHQARGPVIASYLVGARIGRGLSLRYRIARETAFVELYIDFGDGGKQRNTEALNTFLAHRTQIEKVFEGPLEWQDMPEVRACAIRKVFTDGYSTPEEDWPALQNRMIDAMVRLDRALRPLATTLPA
jgi:hypothetical protein